MKTYKHKTQSTHNAQLTYCSIIKNLLKSILGHIDVASVCTRKCLSSYLSNLSFSNLTLFSRTLIRFYTYFTGLFQPPFPRKQRGNSLKLSYLRVIQHTQRSRDAPQLCAIKSTIDFDFES